MSKSNNTGPGAIRSDGSVELHTEQGVYLFNGRDKTKDKPAIYGVPRFAGTVAQVYFDSMADDPWADWILLKVDIAIDNARERLEEIRKEVKKAYPQNRSIRLENQHSVKPVKKPLDFKVPSYPHRMAYLVVDTDYLILEILSLFHNGCMTRQQKERLVHLAGKAARYALQSATGFRHLGVTRNDVKANNPKARKAKELMGEVPEDILNLKVRSDYAPELRQYEESPQESEAAKPAKAAGG